MHGPAWSKIAIRHECNVLRIYFVNLKNTFMKPALNSILVIAGLLIFILSCNKNKDKPASIFGKWSIQIDTSFVGVGAFNHEVIYSGKPGDYFNFNPDGHIYTKEDSVLDTLTYTLSSDSILIKNFSSGYEGEGLFRSPSTNHIVISSGYFNFYGGGTFGRAIYLYR
jgi:hypothetical protein